MSLAALELNDVGLVLRWAEGGSAPSPGCALIENGAVLTGQAAASRARLLPRSVHDRFWAELGTEPLPPPFPPGWSAADLAHEQLRAILLESGRDVRSLIVAVPGSYTGAQLGLLLGIARALPIRVRGLVDAALAAGHSVELSERCVHVEIELHRCVVTELRVDGRLRRGRVNVSDGGGLAALRSALARRVAALFVERTRFDPLSSAAAEQQLFALLPTLARAWAEGRTDAVELQTHEGTVAVSLEPSELEAEARPIIETLLASVRPLVAGRTRVLVSHRAASVPGLRAALQDIAGRAPLILGPDAGAAGALAARDHVEAEGEALPFVVSLPLRTDPAKGGDGAPT